MPGPALCAAFASECRARLAHADRRGDPDLCLRASAAYSSEAKAEARLTAGNASGVGERSSPGGGTLLFAGSGARFSGKKVIGMTAGNNNTGNAGGYKAFPGAGAPQAASHILIAEEQPAIQDLLC